MQNPGSDAGVFVLGSMHFTLQPKREFLATLRITMTVSFEEAIKAAGEKPKSVLLGNGFSIAQAGGRFSYSSLLERSGLDSKSPIRNVFKALKTSDFEEVMRALQHASIVESAYGNKKREKELQGDADSVRDALIHAVRDVHPGTKIDIPDNQLDACATFLDNFVAIFTLNYDLLLYWAILQRAKKHSDGFGLSETIDGFKNFRVDGKCSTHYLHGALHLFLGPQRETQKRIATNGTIVDEIENAIRKRNQLPLFVAEGLSAQKMAKINSVPYLRHCYGKLRDSSGSMFVFGHSVASNDAHIYGAIFASEIDQLFFCVHNLDGLPKLKEKLAPFMARRPKIKVTYVDAATSKVWG